MERRSHASLDEASRRVKAEKIAAIASGFVDLAGASVLEVGTGSGVIAASLLGAVGPAGRVCAVDVRNELIGTGVEFLLVEGTTLPFGAGEFDLVVSNHVVEHVGPRQEQLRHLREMARVVRPGGVVYLATPNRWALFEPHFRLPLLSWLPSWARGPYVRFAGRGTHYDCEPLSRGSLLGLIRRAGLVPHDRTTEAIRRTASAEMSGRVAGVVERIPERLLSLSLPVVPTFVVVARRPS